MSYSARGCSVAMAGCHLCRCPGQDNRIGNRASSGRSERRPALNEKLLEKQPNDPEGRMYTVKVHCFIGVILRYIGQRLSASYHHADMKVHAISCISAAPIPHAVTLSQNIGRPRQLIQKTQKDRQVCRGLAQPCLQVLTAACATARLLISHASSPTAAAMRGTSPGACLMDHSIVNAGARFEHRAVPCTQG